MKNRFFLFNSFLKPNLSLIRLAVIIFTFLISSQILYSQAVYVDSNTGHDNNAGTEEAPLFSIHKAMEFIKSDDNEFYEIKLNPGIYVLDHPLSVETYKNTADKRIVIEASILPGDSQWSPDKMPVIKSRANTGEIESGDVYLKKNWITSFYINESHVTIRGLKFMGHYYLTKMFYAISRFNKTKTDLLVEQCMFLGDKQSSHISVGIIAHGDSIRANHCVFYNTGGSVVYWQNSVTGDKTGNGMTNCIVYGGNSGIYTYSTDNDFVFKNNIISNCKFFWCKGKINNMKYVIDTSVVVNCDIYKSDGETPYEFELIENSVIKEGEISLRMFNSQFEPWPDDHLHILPNTTGYNIGAGLLKKSDRH